MAVDTNNLRKTNLKCFRKWPYACDVVGGAEGCLVCKRKKIKAPLFGCGRSVSLIPGKDDIPSLMIAGAINLGLSSPLDPLNSALWGWTKGPAGSLVDKQKNPPNQTKNPPTVALRHFLRNYWYGNYCSAGKLSPPVGPPQFLPFLLSAAFVFLTHLVFSSMSN